VVVVVPRNANPQLEQNLAPPLGVPHSGQNFGIDVVEVIEGVVVVVVSLIVSPNPVLLRTPAPIP